MYFDNIFNNMATEFGADEEQIDELFTAYLPITDQDC